MAQKPHGEDVHRKTLNPKVVVRRLVSQNKKRFVTEKYDLDLSFITEDIIAMGLPATGLEGKYRNAIDDVVDFLEENYKGRYKVFNLCSEKLYDPEKFGGFIANFPFDDHNCPALEMIPQFVASAKAWLRGGIDNIVCVHCKAGKSRTGLMICCLLLYLGYFKVPEAAMAHFNKQRTRDLRGLVLPSQIRYVYYYDYVLKNSMPPSTPRQLTYVSVENAPPAWRLQITVVRQDRTIIASSIPLTRVNPTLQAVTIPAAPVVAADFKIVFQDAGVIGSRVLFYCWFHSFFVKPTEELDRNTVDKFKEKGSVGDGFRVQLMFADVDDAASNNDAASTEAQVFVDDITSDADDDVDVDHTTTEEPPAQ